VRESAGESQAGVAAPGAAFGGTQQPSTGSLAAQEVEAAFRALKSDLAIRPIWHFTPKRVEAHILVAFLGYCLWVCLKAKLRASAPSLSPWQLLDQFGRIQLVEVWFRLRQGGCICLERITHPEPAQAALINQLGWQLPQQPPPRIYL
jgi:hypothetical protein